MSESHLDPVVSIVTPTYNRADLLRVTMDSVLRQTYLSIEHIVVDDGSTDDTADMVAAYVKEHGDRVRYLRQDNHNDYGSAAIMAGCAATRGRYIGILDSDDVFLPRKVERQVALLDARTDIAMVHCGYHYVDQHGGFLERTKLLPDGSLAELICGNLIWSGAPLMRRECLTLVDNFDTMCRDWRTWLAIAISGRRLACIQEPLGAYRIVHGSMMSNVRALEATSLETLDLVFSKPVSAEIAALRAVAYGRMYFFVGCRYIAAGNGIDGARTIRIAAEMLHELRHQPEVLARLLIDDALSPRVADAKRFLALALDCLAADFPWLARSANGLWCKLNIGLGIRASAHSKMEACRDHFAFVAHSAADPDEYTDDFVQMLSDRAARLSEGDPKEFVTRTLLHLPSRLQAWCATRKRVLGDIYMHQAFASHAAGERGSVVRSVASGLASRPSAALNRGVWSIVLQALMGKTGKQ